MLSPSATDDFKGTFDEHGSSERHDAVVVGLAPGSFTYDTLNQAFRILLPPKNGPDTVDHIPLLTTIVLATFDRRLGSFRSVQARL